jgi:signal-transduction protein with cAMP-binding, CBS, and nucleotidyltransferase domain
MLAQTTVFTRRVGDHMGPRPLVATANESCREVVARLREGGASVVIVEDSSERAVGIVTEQDVSRRIACGDRDDAPVESVMSAPVSTISENDYLYRAIARMRRRGLRHMPVTDDRDRVKEAQMQVALELMDDALPGPEIQALLSRMNNDLYRGVVRLCLREMVSSGLGGPPADFDVVVMGSGGRGESFLRPDQDNGFVIEDYPEAEHDRIDGWFIELAMRVTDALAEVGFEYCNGHVMATNPLWRKTLSEWREQTRIWMGRSQGLALRYCDIFFDFSCVFGAGSLTEQLRTHVSALAPHPFFLRELFKVDEEHGVALGLFDRLKRDPLPGPNQGQLNLKLTGTMPLVGAVRILALRERIRETGTLDRMAGLHGSGVLDDDEHDYLAGAYRHISRLLLRQQLESYRVGQAPGNHVPLEALSEREKDMLVDAFKAIRGFRSRVRHELLADFL